MKKLNVHEISGIVELILAIVGGLGFVLALFHFIGTRMGIPWCSYEYAFYNFIGLLVCGILLKLKIFVFSIARVLQERKAQS